MTTDSTATSSPTSPSTSSSSSVPCIPWGTVLSGSQLAEKRELAKQYRSTWLRNFNNPKTFASSSMIAPLSEIAPLFDKAADIVTRIRGVYTHRQKEVPDKEEDETQPMVDSDSEDEGLTQCCPTTTIEGSAAELLLTEASHPLLKTHSQPVSFASVTENAMNFVSRLVHATVQDADGYVDGLTRERVDELLQQIISHDSSVLAVASTNTAEARYEYGHALTAALNLEWSATQALVRETLESVRDDELLSHDRSPSQLEQKEAAALNALCGDERWQSQIANVREALHSIRTAMSDLAELRYGAKHRAFETLRDSHEMPTPPFVPNIEEEDVEITADAEVPSTTSAATTTATTDADAEPMAVVIEDATPTPIHSTLQEEPAADLDSEFKPEASPSTTTTPAADETEQVEQVQDQQQDQQADTSATMEEDTASTTTAPTFAPSTPDRNSLRTSTTKLEVERVASDVERWEDRIARLEENYRELDLEQLLSEPAEGKKTLQRLQKNCLLYTGSLMLDLDALDRLSVSANTRQLRKDQIIHIQNLLDNLEAIKARLVQMQQKVEEKIPPEEPKPAATTTTTADDSQQQQQQQQPSSEPEQTPEAKTEQPSKQQEAADQEAAKKQQFWRRLKLDPRFEVNETRDSFELLSMIPNMRLSDVKIKLSEDGKSLSVHGFRGPSELEEEEMARIIERQRLELQHSRHGRSLFWNTFDDPRQLDEHEMMARIGAGRFGSFVKSFELPPSGVKAADISASYERGVLRVTIPKDKEFEKKQRQERQRQQQQRQQQRNRGFTARGNPLAGGLFGNPRGGYGDNLFW